MIFGSPAAGMPVMAARRWPPSDLPLKVLVSAEGGQTNVTYYSPGELAARYHHLSAGLAANLAAIDPLINAVVAL